MSFISRLEERARQIDSLLCVGLDAHPEDLPESSPENALLFCQELVAQTADVALAFKPNIAYFERFGGPGLEALRTLIESIPEEIPVILDAKRGDVSPTADAYAEAMFQTLGAQAVTINPYFGEDSITPYLENPEHGVFLVIKTSNPGSADIQNIPMISGQPIYQHLASLSRNWNQNNNIGLTVGATDPGAIRRVRTAAPTTWILSPGIDPDGNNLEKVLRAGIRTDGLGMMISISRGISQADNPGEAARNYVEKINLLRSKWSDTAPVKDRHNYYALASALFQHGCIQFGDFTIDNGVYSPIFIDLRILPSLPRLLFQVASAYQPLLESLTFDRLAVIPYTGLPIGTAVSLQGDYSMIYPRKEAQPGELESHIEGIFNPGERAVVIDDMATTGITKFAIIDNLRQQDVEVEDIVVLIDRESGANQKLVNSGYRLHAVFTLSKLCETLREQGHISADQEAEVLKFIQQTKSP
ncbi:MAG: orotidine-5'-phosphate decarboxylase [Anaerolineales bacterium]|nr:orotidine-5'-phosphate decarboxylase [Anaerolineales bacterium]